MPRISALVITKNEAANITDCLESLAFCDERIVVDAGSDDDTVRLAEQAGARVVHRDWTGFGDQRNFALSLTQGEWIVSIDADERVTPQLAAEIREAVVTHPADGYEMPRLSFFCGRPIRYSGWYPDYAIRVLRRDRAHFTDDAVHESVICDGPVGHLAAPLLHYAVPRLEDALSRVDRYSTIRAASIVRSGKRVSFAKGVLRGAVAFLKAYVLKAGFLDGREGFLLAVYSAESSFYRYMKAWVATRPQPAPVTTASTQ